MGKDYDLVCNDIIKIFSHYLGQPRSSSYKNDIYFKCHVCGKPKLAANSEKLVAHCFSCGWKGNSVQLIMYMENTHVSNAIEIGHKILGTDCKPVTPEPYESRPMRYRNNAEINLFSPIRYAIFSDIYFFYLENNSVTTQNERDGISHETHVPIELIDTVSSYRENDIEEFLIKKYGKDIILTCPGFSLINEEIQFCCKNHIIFPYWHPLDRDKIIAMNGKNRDHASTPKYKWLTGLDKHLYVPRTVDLNTFMVITEGEKKAMTLSYHGVPTVSVSGVNCFRVPELLEIDLNDRTIYICYDNEKPNPNVRQAEVSLKNHLESMGAKAMILTIPSGYKVDDYFLEIGSIKFSKLLKDLI